MIQREASFCAGYCSIYLTALVVSKKANPILFYPTDHWRKELWEVVSRSESIKLLVRPAENSTSGWGSFWERSLLGSWIFTSVRRNVPRTVAENVRNCGFKRISSNLDRAPRMRHSVLLKSWDNFLVTLLSISWETCVMYSLVIPGTDVFCDWLFLKYCCVSLDTAANFRLFPNVAISWEKSVQQFGKLKYFVFFIQFQRITENVFI